MCFGLEKTEVELLSSNQGLGLKVFAKSQYGEQMLTLLPMEIATIVWVWDRKKPQGIFVGKFGIENDLWLT